MNSTDRKNHIIECLNKNHIVKIIQLSKELKVTRETIRKDIYELAEEGVIRKVHGGAVLDNTRAKSSYDSRIMDNQDAKEKIAALAASYIEPGDCIYLDYGTTAYALAQEVASMENITVVTNSIKVVNLLMNNDMIDVIVLGGKLRKNEDSLFGVFAMNNLDNIFVNYGFFGCGGIDPQVGITNHNSEEAQISQELMKRSQVKVILADHTKFGSVTLNRIAHLEDIDIVITDREVAGEVKEVLSGKNVELICPTATESED